VPPDTRDAHRFVDRVLEIVPRVGHFLHLEAPQRIAARIRASLA
jgi:pimeloyl-ACP methyl ester carboxylesterase